MSNLKNFNSIIKNNFISSTAFNLKDNGWDDLLNSLHRKLLILDENYKIVKLLDKNGVLDIEISCRKTPPAIYRAINRYIAYAIDESELTCIRCGDSKFIQKTGSKTLFFCKNCISSDSDS